MLFLKFVKYCAFITPKQKESQFYMKKALNFLRAFCTSGETPFDCAQDKLLASPLILEFSKNKKANSLKLAFLLSTGGETQTP